MKRPFTVLSIVFIIFLSVLQAVGWSEEDQLLLQTEQLLADSIGEGNFMTVQGTAMQCSRISSGIRLFVDHISIQRDGKSDISLLPQTKISIITENDRIYPGDQVRISGELTFWESSSNPGQFDTKAYYFSKNTVCSLKNPRIQKTEDGCWSVPRILYKIRKSLDQSYHRILDEKAAGTITAISLGEKGVMDDQWKETFQEGGIAHILAVSGLHVTLIGMGLYRLLRRLTCPISFSSLLSGTVVFLYALMTGFGLSAIRASAMFLIWLGAQITGRKYDRITATAAAAVFLLIRDSSSMGESSFLLSFSAVLILAVLVPCVQETCGILSSIGRNLASGMVIWIGTLPVTLYFFYQTSPWSFLLNLLVVPLMSLIMSVGLAAAGIGIFNRLAGTFLAAPVYYLLHLFEKLCQLEQQMPQNLWVAGRPELLEIVIYYIVLGGCAVGAVRWSKKNPRKMETGKTDAVWQIRIVWILCSIFCISLMRAERPENLQITCLDVGQGDCALIRFPTGEVYLVDGGSTSERSVWKYRISQTVKYYGIQQIDGIFLSHADQDHINGITEFLQEYENGFDSRNTRGISAEKLFLPPAAEENSFEEVKLLAEEKGIPVLNMQKGSRIVSAEDGWEIRCLAPDASFLSGDSNEDSMVLMLQYGDFCMLFTGDLEGNAEEILAETGEGLDADVLKVGHHGSANGSCESFLEQVTPTLSLISCSKNNSYGHPAPETVRRLEQIGSSILSTPDSGAITVLSDGKKFSVQSFKQQNTREL